MRTQAPAAMVVGKPYTSAERRITEADLELFEGLTGDPGEDGANGLHRDGAFAGILAPGMLVVCCASGLVPLDGWNVVGMRSLSEVRFQRTLSAGDWIHVISRIEDVEPLDGQLLCVTCRWRIANRAGATVARARLELICRGEGWPEPGAGAAATVDELADLGIIPV